MRRILALVVAVATFATPAAADMTSMADPSDTRGPLDIKRISHGHATRDVLWHKLVMYRRWGAKDLTGDEIVFHISTDGEDRYDEVRASVGVEEGRLAVRIYEFTEGSDYGIAGPSKRIRFKRPDHRTIKVFFNESWVKGRSYAWSVSSQYRDRGSAHCSNHCFDYAPGRNPNRLRHRL